MLNWWQWLAVGAVPPAIVLLYFLKLRRVPVEVPSTYLWRRSIEDLHVNSLWQRLRRSLLLFLQLLLIGLVILALLGPNWAGSRLVGDRFIFLIDNSASMTATDADGNRLAEAKQQAAAVIEQMQGSDVGMIVSFSDVAQVDSQFTDNRGTLQEKLDRIAPTPRGTSLLEALRVSAGLANPGRTADPLDSKDRPISEALPAAIYIFSDGRFAPVEGFSLGNLEPHFQIIGQESTENIGVAAFETRRNDRRADRLQAFARIENYSSEQREVDVELYLDEGETPIDVKRVVVPAREDNGVAGATGVEFTLREFVEGVLTVRLQVDDALALDNVAWAAVNRPRRGRVLIVTPGNPWLEVALATEDVSETAEVEILTPAEAEGDDVRKRLVEGKYDLVVYDRVQPTVNDDPADSLAKLPRANTFFFGSAPPDGRWNLGERVQIPAVIDSDREHPLTAFLELGDVLILEAAPVEGPPGAKSLIDSTGGSLLSIAPREGFEDAVLSVEFAFRRDDELVVNTNWPRKLSFPLFVHNIVAYLGGGQTADASPSVRPGEPIVLQSDSQLDELVVESPRGVRTIVQRGAAGGYVYSGANELGVYKLLEGNEVAQRFTVNLFDDQESDVAVRPEAGIDIGYTKVAASGGREAARIHGWKLLAILALGVLLFEWYVYNQRVYL